MPRSKRNKQKLPLKGRGRVTRKTSRGPQILKNPSSQFYADAETATVKYTDSYIAAQSATGGTLSQLIYKLNSVFQVNQTAAAGTPQGVASLSGKFKKYIVSHSRIHWRIRALQPGGTFGSLGALGAQATNSDLMSAVLYPSPTAMTLPSTIAGASVQKYATKRFDWPRDRPVIAGAYEPTQTNPAEVWTGTSQITPTKLDASPDMKVQEYQAVFGADPANIQYWVFNFQDVLADATAKGVWFVEVELWQQVYAFDRVDVNDAFNEDFPPVVYMDPKAESKSRLVGSPDVKEPASPPETVDRYTLVELKDPPSERKASIAPPSSARLGAGDLPPRALSLSTITVPPDRGLLGFVRGR